MFRFLFGSMFFFAVRDGQAFDCWWMARKRTVRLTADTTTSGGQNTEARTPNTELRTEPEHEPRTENPEA